MINKPLRALLWCAVSTKRQAADDKSSLVVQEAEQRALAASMGWQVIDILRVPGHSRRRKDIRELATAMQKRGIDAFSKLLQYFEARSFDVLIVRDGSRFARTQSLHSYITEECIDIGARIYSIADGMVDETNYRMWTSMSGFASATEVDNLKKRHMFGMLKRLEDGKPTASNNTLTHRKVRDERGHSYTYATREDMRLAWSVIIEALLQGESYTRIAQILHEHSIPPPIGDAWYPKMISANLLNPIAWGHVARYYHKRYGVWAFDVGEPLPDRVVINRNTHEPYWTGEIAIHIQNELRRRERSMRGRAWPANVSAFSGLVFCGCCGKRMTYRWIEGKNWEVFVCPFRYNARTQTYDTPCSCKKKSIPVANLVSFMTPVLERLKVHEISNTPIITDNTLDLYENELAEVGKTLGQLYVDRARVPISAIEYLNAEITAHEARVATLKAQIARLQTATVMTAQQTAAKRTAQDALRELTMDELWAQPPHVINQLLHGLLAGGRILVTDGEVTGVELT